MTTHNRLSNNMAFHHHESIPFVRCESPILGRTLHFQGVLGGVMDLTLYGTFSVDASWSSSDWTLTPMNAEMWQDRLCVWGKSVHATLIRDGRRLPLFSVETRLPQTDPFPIDKPCSKRAQSKTGPVLQTLTPCFFYGKSRLFDFWFLFRQELVQLRKKKKWI